MTDKELIKAFRECKKYPGCVGCPVEHIGFADCELITEFTTKTLIDRLEALLAEVAEMDQQIQKEICKRVDVERESERLKEQIPQWVSVDERLPETEGDVLVTVNGKIGEIEYVGGYLLAEYVPGEGWILEEYPQLENPDVTYWCYLPEPPSTEGVE